MTCRDNGVGSGNNCDHDRARPHFCHLDLGEIRLNFTAVQRRMRLLCLLEFYVHLMIYRSIEDKFLQQAHCLLV